MSQNCKNGTWQLDNWCEPDHFSQDVVFEGYIPIAIAIIGVIFNMLTIAIIRGINRKNPVANLIMTLIAISDSVEIVNYVFRDCLNPIFPNFLENPYQRFRKNNLIWSRPFQATTMTFNRWLVLMLTCNTWLILKDACNLKKHDKRMQSKRIKGVVVASIVLGVASILVNVPLILQFKYPPCDAIGFGAGGERGVSIVVADSACLPAYLWGYLSGCLLGMNTFLPAILQILMNSYIIKVLVKQKSMKANIVTSKGAKQDSESRIIMMCLTVALVYLLLQIPYIILTVEKTRTTVASCHTKTCKKKFCECYLVHDEEYCINPEVNTICHPVIAGIIGPNNSIQNDELEMAILKYTNLGLILNCSINMIIYMAYSPNFRKEFYYLLRLDRIQELVSSASGSRCSATEETNLRDNAPRGQESIRMQPTKELTE